MKASKKVGVLLACVTFAVAAGCSSSKVAQSSGDGVAGERPKQGALLAYEHRVSIRYASDVVAAREEALRKACATEQFGQCSLLGLKRTTGKYASGEVVLRVAPEAVEPMVELAGDGGTIRSHETRAEDLAEAVADTEKARALLDHQRAIYERLQERKDAPVADQLAVARELAALQVASEANAKTAAQQQRRIETNLLTFDLRVNDEESRTSRIGTAFANLGDSFAEGIAESLGMAGYGLPFLVLAFFAALLWRWVWRRITRPRTG